MEKTIAPSHWNEEHAAPSWLCLTASPAAVARAKLKARLREEATAARVSDDEYLPHSTGEGDVHHGVLVLPRVVQTSGAGTAVRAAREEAARVPREHFSPRIVKHRGHKKWQPSCETCSPIVAPACTRACPDRELVDGILKSWRAS